MIHIFWGAGWSAEHFLLAKYTQHFQPPVAVWDNIFFTFVISDWLFFKIDKKAVAVHQWLHIPGLRYPSAVGKRLELYIVPINKSGERTYKDHNNSSYVSRHHWCELHNLPCNSGHAGKKQIMDHRNLYISGREVLLYFWWNSSKTRQLSAQNQETLKNFWERAEMSALSRSGFGMIGHPPEPDRCKY